MTNTDSVYTKIKKRPVYSEHIPKKARVPKPTVHVQLGQIGNVSLYDAYAKLVYNTAVLLARRGDEV